LPPPTALPILAIWEVAIGIGLFIGPFLGAAAISLALLRAAYGLAIVSAGLAALLLLVIPDIEPAGARASRPPRIG